MRAWEPEPGELKGGGKAWNAFKVYRDLGSERTLKTAAGMIYGVGVKHGLRTVEKWSSRFDWVARARAFDDWREMIRLGAIEEYERTAGAEYARKQEKLREKTLELGEKAAEQALRMLDYPLVEQRTVGPDPDTGEPVTVVLTPARWTKGTIAQLYALAAKAAGEPERMQLDHNVVGEITHKGGLTRELALDDRLRQYLDSVED